MHSFCLMNMHESDIDVIRRGRKRSFIKLHTNLMGFFHISRTCSCMCILCFGMYILVWDLCTCVCLLASMYAYERDFVCIKNKSKANSTQLPQLHIYCIYESVSLYSKPPVLTHTSPRPQDSAAAEFWVFFWSVLETKKHDDVISCVSIATVYGINPFHTWKPRHFLTFQ